MNTNLEKSTKEQTGNSRFEISTPNQLNQIVQVLDKIYKNKYGTENTRDKFISIIFDIGLYKPIPLKYSTIEVRSSKIHGNGVFATNDIPQGTIITFYPTHAIYLDDGLLSPKISNTNNFLNNVIEFKYAKTYGVSDYSYGYNFLNIIGDPARHDNKSLLGHMINDAVGNVFKDISYSDIQNQLLFKNTVSSYYIKSVNSMNCRLVYHQTCPIVYVLTTRDIIKDEELLSVYGPCYWFDENYNKNNQQDNEFQKIHNEIYDMNYLNFMMQISSKLCPERIQWDN